MGKLLRRPEVVEDFVCSHPGPKQTFVCMRRALALVRKADIEPTSCVCPNRFVDSLMFKDFGCQMGVENLWG